MEDAVHHPGADLRSRLEAYMEQTSVYFRLRVHLQKEGLPITEVEGYQKDLDQRMQKVVGYGVMPYFRKAAMELYRTRRDKKEDPTSYEIMEKYLKQISDASSI